MSDTIKIGSYNAALTQVVRTTKATKKTAAKSIVSLIPTFEDADTNVSRSNFLAIMGGFFDAAESKGAGGGVEYVKYLLVPHGEDAFVAAYNPKTEELSDEVYLDSMLGKHKRALKSALVAEIAKLDAEIVALSNKILIEQDFSEFGGDKNKAITVYGTLNAERQKLNAQLAALPEPKPREKKAKKPEAPATVAQA